MASNLSLLAPVVALSLATGDDPAARAARDQARLCVAAVVAGDLGKVADLTHPRALAAAGGRQKMIDALRRARAGLEADGVSYLSGEAGLPASLHRGKGGLYCVVPVAYRIRSGDDRYRLRSPLVAVSADEGRTWRFADTAPGEEAVRKVIPEIPRDLAFPADEEPTIEPAGG